MKYLYFWSMFFLTALNAEEITIFLNPLNTNNELSSQQNSQLQFLTDQLRDYANLTKKYWTNNINVRIMIETTELAVQQSLPATQELMRTKIISIFQQFGINIYFTQDNLIRRIKPSKKSKQITPPGTIEKKEPKHVVHIHLHEEEPYVPPTPPKIKGAQKTFRKLKQARLAREAQERAEYLNFITEEYEKKLNAAHDIFPEFKESDKLEE
jgi:hypothetical protein